MRDTHMGRRQFMAATAAFGVLALRGSPARSQTTVTGKAPDPSTFRAGDFIWPKKEGQFVPYAGTTRAGAIVDEEELTEEEWQRLRIQYIRKARSPAGARAPDAAYRAQVADRLEEMTYTEFFHDYAAGVTPNRYQTYGFSKLLYVGHMGLIDVDAVSGRPMVIEAVKGKSLACRSCVQRVPYDDWLRARGDVFVWHGRLRGADAATGKKIAEVAASQAQKPYDFLNWDLLDDSGFYCSKLAWYATFKASGIALDANPDPKRYIWFSPLQAVRRSKEIELLFSPGDYQNL